MSSNSILAHRPHWRKRLRRKLLVCYRANSVFGPLRTERGVTGRTPPRSRRPLSSTGPLLVAMLAGLAGVALIMAWRTALEDTLYIPRIDRATAPILDGDAPDAAWRLATYLSTDVGALVKLANGLHNVPQYNSAASSPRLDLGPEFGRRDSGGA